MSVRGSGILVFSVILIVAVALCGVVLAATAGPSPNGWYRVDGSNPALYIQFKMGEWGLYDAQGNLIPGYSGHFNWTPTDGTGTWGFGSNPTGGGTLEWDGSKYSVKGMSGSTTQTLTAQAGPPGGGS